MIIMVTQLYPATKANEVAEKYLQAAKTPLPSYIKKWHTFSTPEGSSIKAYNLIMVERGKADEAQIHIMKTFAPFYEVEGLSLKSEMLMGVRDSFKAIGRTI